jgi:hypothetical protein
MSKMDQNDHPTTPVQEMAPAEEKLTTAQLAGAAEKATHSPEPAAKPDAEHGADTSSPLLERNETSDFQHRWDEIQASFVDEPRRAVQDADGLVAGAMKRLAEVFASERENLEAQWDRGDDVSTEDLRVALRRYRSFFGRLLVV